MLNLTARFFKEAIRCFYFLAVAILPSSAQQFNLLDSARHTFRAQPDKALMLLSKVEAEAIKVNDHKSLIEAGIIQGNILYFQGEHNNALKSYLNALQLAERYNQHELIASASNEIGTLFKKNKDLDQAMQYYQRALKESLAIKNNAQQANAYNNIGLVYEEKGNYGLALAQYQKSLNAYQKAKDKLGESYSLEYIGYVYNLMKNFKPAIANLERSLLLRTALKDNYGIAICLTELAEVNRNKNDFEQAINYANKAVAFCRKINYPDMLQNAYLLLSQLYELKKDYQAAYQAHQQYVAVKDSVFTIAKANQINELQTKYETEKKKQQIVLLSTNNKIQQLELSRRNTIITIISAALVCGLLISLLFYNRYKLKQESKLQAEVIKQQDLATKAVLNAEENERKRISSELHDGLGQMFSAVKMNLSGISQNLHFKDENDEQIFDKTLSLVDESCREVRVIAHQMAPNILLKSGLITAIRDFIDKIDTRKLKISLETFGLNERLDQNTEMVLYRIIQESVNNVIKHAEANSLAIQITKDEEGLNAMIEDNGKGFDSSKIENFEGLGLKNLISRVAYLKGQVDFSSEPGKGTLVAIHIP
ncbi:sensor histidine kinase [Pedobacter aquatilis]|uniref:tetratricopeptide repeat-containing sensor histidine kinase n=1 Tax=Pedobacter aquatilis TaxID=351343 RepID=UPI00292D9D56|nr:sensor histidine kinase [Pedobacter aquatilis]